MRRFYSRATGMLLACLLFTACNDKKGDYPANYVGFEHSTETYLYNRNASEETLTVKVIAVDKSKEDRKVKLNVNRPADTGMGEAFTLADDLLTIKAGKKEATATLKLYPQKVLKGTFIVMTCTPQWKDGQSSKISIRLTPK